MTQSRETLNRIGRMAGEAASRLLFPPTCPSCRRIVSRPGTVCPTCWPAIRFLEKPWCPVMGTPFSHDLGESVLSAEAIADPPPFARLRSAAFHDGVAARLVRQLKYSDATQLAPWMARWMLRAGSELIADADLIVPVPLHRGRLFTRRFNQSAELSRAISGLTGIGHQPEVLVRKKRTRQQVGLTATARTENVRGAFLVPEEKRIIVTGRRVLLIDDVYTTGATVRACARALLRGGSSAVDVLTFTRAPRGDYAEGDTLTI